MFRESQPIAYDAPADLKKWPSLNNERVASKTPYLVYNGTLADCIRELLAKPLKQISLYDIVTERQPAFDGDVHKMQKAILFKYLAQFLKCWG